jgi:WhiB family transcriptional regulator, redox-sensing transcriptional regulator
MSSDWRARAACKGQPTEWWFPESGDARTEYKSPHIAYDPRAVAFCKTCPVSVDCASWAIDTGQHSGLWGVSAFMRRQTTMRRAS